MTGRTLGRIAATGALAAIGLATAAACSGSDGATGVFDAGRAPDAAPDAAHPRDAGDAGDAARVCQGVALGGDEVTSVTYSGRPPDDLGGAIVPGTYDLTAVDLYHDEPESSIDAGIVLDAGTPSRARATLSITADQLVVARSDEGGPVTVTIAAQHVDGVFLVTEQSCPGTDAQQTPFTATPTTLTLHTAQSRDEVFTLRN